MRVEKITGHLGADVSEVDVADANSSIANTLRELLDEYLVLRIQGQSLDRFQLSRLGAHFGPHFRHPIVDNGFDDCPEVLELRREPGDTTVFGGESWHADISWMKPTGYVSALHAQILPPVGGDTAFASTIAAFDSLSDGLKDTLRNLRAVHAYHWYERREEPPYVVEHPVVRTHPVNGREGLYVNRMFTSRLCGMTIDESRPLLEQLFAVMERHEFTCRFRWRAGDLVLWDNRFTLHYPINDFSDERRVMIRTSVMDGR